MKRALTPFYKPNIGREEVSAVARVLRSGWLTTGPVAKRFSSSFAERVGARYAVPVCSGTAALHLALDAIGVRPGDEVVVPTMTFAATAEVVNYMGARPVLVDCRPDTLNMDADLLERAVTSRTRAVIPVHYAGQPCEMDRIMAVARRRGLAVVEDAAHALPAGYQGRPVGSIGDITCFSFHAIKPVTTGEGGMATTAHKDYADRMRLMSLHGITRDAWQRYRAGGGWRYEIKESGFKYNMTDVAAAIGLCQLRKCQAAWRLRSRFAAMYREALSDCDEIELPSVLPDVQHAWHLFAIRLRLRKLGISRDRFIELLARRGIGTSVHFIPLHLHPYYRRRFGFRAGDFPNASEAYRGLVSLPLYPTLGEKRVLEVAEQVKAVIARHRRI